MTCVCDCVDRTALPTKRWNGCTLGSRLEKSTILRHVEVGNLFFLKGFIVAVFNLVSTLFLFALPAASMVSWHPDYAILAGRIEVSKLHKETTSDFATNITNMRNYRHPETGEAAPLLDKFVYQCMMVRTCSFFYFSF